MPLRPYGKTGVQVSILSLGGVLGMSDQLMFRQAVKMGVTYWDTADSYGLGKNEKAIGKYFAKFPDDRKKVFLVTKTATANPEKLTAKLNSSLQNMNTSYVDLYFIHHLSDVENKLTSDVRAWVEKAKTEGKINFFAQYGGRNIETDIGVEGARMIEIMGTFEIMFSSGEYFAGVHEAPDRNQALKIALLLAESLKKKTG